MADPVEVKITGLEELQHRLEEELPNKARMAVRVALSAGGGTVKSEMVAHAPVEHDGPDAGFLRDNIRVKTVLRRGDLAGTAIVGPTEAVYPERQGKRGEVNFTTITGRAIKFILNKAGAVTAAMVARYLEFGTSRMAKHPWMTQSWERSKDAALQRIVDKLKERLGV